uniref:Immunoglobulin domain-containing protein n=1 Tax=Gopherus agassizii TaxID=38772 RepID=A0A452J2N3_9SAUR
DNAAVLCWGDSLPCYSSGLTGPGEVSSPLGESVSVLCQYHERHQGNRKYWCRGAVWRSCHIAVETTGSEAEAKEGRVSIRDNHRLRTFTVTMENLRLGDAGIYWCGISKFGFDPGVPVKVTVLPGECLLRSLHSSFIASEVDWGMGKCHGVWGSGGRYCTPWTALPVVSDWGAVK